MGSASRQVPLQKLDNGSVSEVLEQPELTTACSATGLPVLRRDPSSAMTARRALPRGGASVPYEVSCVPDNQSINQSINMFDCPGGQLGPNRQQTTDSNMSA